MILPEENAEEGAIVSGPVIYAVKDLGEAVALLNGERLFTPLSSPPAGWQMSPQQLMAMIFPRYAARSMSSGPWKSLRLAATIF